MDVFNRTGNEKKREIKHSTNEKRFVCLFEESVFGWIAKKKDSHF